MKLFEPGASQVIKVALIRDRSYLLHPPPKGSNDCGCESGRKSRVRFQPVQVGVPKLDFHRIEDTSGLAQSKVLYYTWCNSGLDMPIVLKHNGHVEFGVTMNRLDRKARAQILGMMVEGVSMQSITRLTGISKNTV